MSSSDTGTSGLLIALAEPRNDRVTVVRQFINFAKVSQNLLKKSGAGDGPGVVHVYLPDGSSERTLQFTFAASCSGPGKNSQKWKEIVRESRRVAQEALCKDIKSLKKAVQRRDWYPPGNCAEALCTIV